VTGGRGARPGPCDVLHLAWSGQIGGAERLIAGFLEAAAEREGLVHRACFLRGRGPIGDRLVERGLAVRLDLAHGWEPAAFWRIPRALRLLRPRVVISYTHALAPSLLALLVRPRGRRILHESSVLVFAPPLKFRLAYPVLDRTTDIFVAPTAAVRPAIEARGVRGERIRVLRNGVPTAAAGARPEPREPTGVVGVVARLAPQKRVDLLVDVVGELRRRGVACSGLVVGGGAERAALGRRAAALGPGAVEFAGEAVDVLPWLDRLDVFLSTSEVETFGMAPVEAMARGVPVVAMPTGGALDEVVGAGGGLVLPDREIATAADAVQSLLGSAAARDELTRRGRDVGAAHAFPRLLERLDALCGELLATPRGRPAPAAAGAPTGRA
jgi:glycosyltransferase involved in cell wall biosynthesis